MQPQLPEGYSARAGTLDDLDAVIELVDALERSFGLEPDANREEMTWLWRLPSMDLDRDTRVVTAGDAVVGYANVARVHPQETSPWHVRGRVHPSHHGRGVGAWLAAWNEQAVASLARTGIRSDVIAEDASAAELLRVRGYVDVRSFFTMCRPLAEEDDAGTLPPGIRIRPFRDVEDDRLLFELEERAFAEHWGFEPTTFESWNDALKGEDWDPSLVWIAEADGAPAGFNVSFLFEQCGYVGILGVVREFRGRGIATALLHASFHEFARRGNREARLGVDALNTTGAVALYERVGMRVCRRYDLYDLGTEEAANVSGGAETTA
ncbi:MAG: GNAT family N-acetyltransferase [Actinomycetota bacterium]